MVKKFY